MLRRRILALMIAELFACDAPPRRDAEQAGDRVQATSETQPTQTPPPPQLGAPEPRCQAIQREAIPSDASLVLIVSDTMRRDVASIYRRDGSGLSRARTPT